MPARCLFKLLLTLAMGKLTEQLGRAGVDALVLLLTIALAATATVGIAWLHLGA